VEQEDGDPTQNVAVTDCGDGTWCCQGNNTQCCEEKKGVSIAATIGVSSTSAPTSSFSSSTASTTSTTSMTSTAASMATSTNTDASATSQPEQVGLSGGAKIGIAVTVPLVVISISGAIGFWIRHRKKYQQYSTKTLSQGSGSNAQELAVSEVPQELPEERGPGHFQYEMEGDSPPIAELAAERYSRGMLPDLNRYTPRRKKLLQ
jgi:hypothetical protein